MRKHIYTLIFLFASVIAVAQNKTLVSLKEGQEIKVTAAMEQNTEMGMGMDMKMNTKTTALLKVKKVTDNYILMSNKVTHMTTDIDAMGQSQSFDSDKKEDLDSEEGRSMKDLLDDESFFSLDKTTGKFSTVDKDGNMIPEDKEDKAGDNLQMGAGAMNSASNMKSVITVLPANVKAGYTWTDSADVNGIKTFTTNTVNKIDNGIAYIDIKGTTSGSTSMSMQGNDMDVTVDGNFTGKSEVNIKTNLTKMQNLTNDTKSSVDVMGQKMEMTTKGTTTLTFE